MSFSRQSDLFPRVPRKHLNSVHAAYNPQQRQLTQSKTLLRNLSGKRRAPKIQSRLQLKQSNLKQIYGNAEACSVCGTVFLGEGRGRALTAKLALVFAATATRMARMLRLKVRRLGLDSDAAASGNGEQCLAITVQPYGDDKTRRLIFQKC